MKNIIEELYERNLLNKIKDFKITYSTNQKGIHISEENIGNDNEDEYEQIFIMGCPVTYCPNKSKLFKWMHECGASETIDRYGIVRCKNNHLVGDFLSFQYSCGAHNFEYGGQLIQFFNSFSLAAYHYGNDFAKKFLSMILEKKAQG